jgi:prevent-host-death family protein
MDQAARRSDGTHVGRKAGEARRGDAREEANLGQDAQRRRWRARRSTAQAEGRFSAGGGAGAEEARAARRVPVGHIGHVRTTSLADAKAHLSKLVDDAEHHGKPIVILRHGKPAAMLTPIPPRAANAKASATKLSDRDVEKSVRAFIKEFSATDPDASAVDDLIAGRR